MPNFDGGHYFLTVLAPIDTTRLFDHDGIKSSAVHMLRTVLATLPTALQTPVTEKIALNSPFARARKTHFARFAVIDDAVYNGRDPVDALQIAVVGPNPVIAQAQDRLSCPYLMFAADFDAASGDADVLKSYLAELWDTMGAELRAVFQYCFGFDAVRDASSFGDYIVKCQVETTMPFNDYWVQSPPLASLKNLLLGTIAVLAVVSVAAGVLIHVNGGTWGWTVLGGLGVFLLSLIVPYKIIVTHGQKPFPTAPNADLPSVLKALYLQQKFTRLAIDAQGAGDGALHDLFGRFLTDHCPGDLNLPTQSPGVVRS